MNPRFPVTMSRMKTSRRKRPRKKTFPATLDQYRQAVRDMAASVDLVRKLFNRLPAAEADCAARPKELLRELLYGRF